MTISLVVLFGVALIALLRFRYLRFGSALIAIGFGYFLASTGAAPTINDLIDTLTATFSS
ncbi:hypothetical protein ACWD33_05595 [Streptomyces xiamenensis]